MPARAPALKLNQQKRLGRGALLPFFYKDFGHYGPMPWQTGNNWGCLSGF